MLYSFLKGVFGWVISSYFGPSLKVLKLRAAIYYLEGVKGAHRILILVCMLVFVITLVGAGLVLIPLSLLLFAPWELASKAIAGMAIGATYLLVSAGALISLLSEKRWMRLTGSTEVLRNTLG